MFTTAPASIVRTLVAASATAVFAGLCLFGATAPAAATTVAAHHSIVVAYGDLNLESRAGRKALDTRIVQAARSICRDGSREPAMRQASAACFEAAVNSARLKVLPTVASAN